MKKTTGFTLLELMIVLVIITIIATASVPQVQLWTARNRGATAVAQIISDFSKAKSIAAYSVNNDGDYVGGRPFTSIMFRQSRYTILQKTASTSWNDATDKNVKRVALPTRVTIRTINAGTVSDTGTAQTLVFTSTGRLKKSDNTLVPFGIGTNSKCGTVTSPLDGRRVLLAIIRSEISATKAIWYRVEIDTTGEFFVCSMYRDNTNQTSPPAFTSARAQVLEL